MTVGAFHAALRGGSKRELRNAAVVDAVLADPARVHELFACVLDDDEYVRMRASDALEKVCRAAPAIVEPLTIRILAEMPTVDQPSVQWHFAQIATELALTRRQRDRAVAVLKRNLDRYRDWIVVNLTLQALAFFAETDPALRADLLVKLDAYLLDHRKSVAARARKLHASLSTPTSFEGSRR